MNFQNHRYIKLLEGCLDDFLLFLFGQLRTVTIDNEPWFVGKRVVTFKDIDTVHKRPDGTASRNFRENRQRFISGVDFYSVEITNDEFRRQFGISKNAGRTITLITETGYLMLVKSFTDDFLTSDHE